MAKSAPVTPTRGVYVNPLRERQYCTSEVLHICTQEENVWTCLERRCTRLIYTITPSWR